jgi:DNA-binding transcriptional MocR family regulator
MNNQDRIEKAYVENYNAAIVALQAIERAIHEMHAPESGYVTWTRVGDMGRIASDLELITEYLLNP